MTKTADRVVRAAMARYAEWHGNGYTLERTHGKLSRALIKACAAHARAEEKRRRI